MELDFKILAIGGDNRGIRRLYGGTQNDRVTNKELFIGRLKKE
jgi:hypothetical protein